MQHRDKANGDGAMNRILEAFAENHPTPTARDVIEYKRLHPRYADEIVELAGLLLEGALHRGREEDHIVDAADVRAVTRIFSETRREAKKALNR